MARKTEYTALFEAWAEWREREGVYYASSNNYSSIRLGQRCGATSSLTTHHYIDDAVSALQRSEPKLHSVLEAHYCTFYRLPIGRRCKLLGVAAKTYYARLAKAEDCVLVTAGIKKEKTRVIR